MNHPLTFGELRKGDKFEFVDKGENFQGTYEKTSDQAGNRKDGGSCICGPKVAIVWIATKEEMEARKNEPEPMKTIYA